MADDNLTVHPEEMARAGEALREPGEIIRQAFSYLASDRGDVSTIWEPGDEIANSLEKNLLPQVEMLDKLGETLVIAFDRTADQVLRSARNYQVSEESAIDVSNDLDVSTGSGGGRR